MYCVQHLDYWNKLADVRW